MRTNASAFIKAITKAAEDVPEDVLVPFQQRIASQIIRGAVEKTPVYNAPPGAGTRGGLVRVGGTARGGWQLSIGSKSSASGPVDKTGGDTIARGLSVLASLRPFDVVYIQNNVEYIIYLEEGSSKQAPAGMLSVTLGEVASQFT